MKCNIKQQCNRQLFLISKLTTETLEQGAKLSLKLTITKPERRQCRSGVIIINFELNFTPCSSVSVVNFEHINAGWVLQSEILRRDFKKNLFQVNFRKYFHLNLSLTHLLQMLNFYNP